MPKKTTKPVAGVKFAKTSSFPKPRTYPGVGSGRSGPPMVNVGSKKGRVGSAKTLNADRERGGRFSQAGKGVTKSNSHSGDPHPPMIGKKTGHGSFASLGIHKSK